MWKPKITWFSVPSALSLAGLEMQDAQRDLLKAQTGLDYAAAMVQYHTTRIDRLRAYIERTKNDDPNRRHPLPD